MTSLPSLSLSLSVCISLSHRKYLTHNIGSASALPIREREIDGSDVIIVALKLAMSSHFPLPKNRTFRFSLHTFCLIIVALKITRSVAKTLPSLFRLSLEWREPRDEWSKTQDKWSNSAQSYYMYYRKRGSASYIVREVHSVRERERDTEREREKDGSDVTIGTLKLAMSFALLFAKNVHLSTGEEVCAFPCQKICTSASRAPLLNGAEFTLSVVKTLHFSKQFAFFALSNGVIDRVSKQQTIRSNFRLHRSSFSSKNSKKWIKLIPKTIGNRKRDCAWGCAWGINTTWENLQIEKHKSGRRSFRSPNWFVHFDVQIFSGGVYSPSATSRTISFSIPIVFG